MIDPSRIEPLNEVFPHNGKFVMYWMQASQRAQCNHALEYAIQRGNELRQPVVVFFGLTDDYPEANERHYAFMLEGLSQTCSTLRSRGMQLVLRLDSPEKAACEFAREGASLVVTDRGYLRHQKIWRAFLAKHAGCEVVQVETDVVVPTHVVSNKEEFAARTIRPKIHAVLQRFLVELPEEKPLRDSLKMKFVSENAEDHEALLAKLKVNRSVPRVAAYRGGYAEADKLLNLFLLKKINDYAELRNQPTMDYVSHMSPYLHFGQISPLEIALRAMKKSGVKIEARDTFIEELIVRRELAMNFCEFNPNYDKYLCLPNWARKELDEHQKDPRKPAYSRKQLEAAQTHDPYWNAAQLEMVHTGKMHNYMRMYWGKKILEWVASPSDAFDIAIYLNNKYELDGRDPNSYAGVTWCFGKHDRPWTPRAIFGSVRYMNDKGLERKCDIKGYVKKIEAIAPSETKQNLKIKNPGMAMPGLWNDDSK